MGLLVFGEGNAPCEFSLMGFGISFSFFGFFFNIAYCFILIKFVGFSVHFYRLLGAR